MSTGSQLELLTSFIKSEMPQRAMQSFTSEMTGLKTIPAARDMGLGQVQLSVIRYDAELIWERFPYRECDPRLLMALLEVWQAIDSQDRDLFSQVGITNADPDWDIELIDEETAIVTVTVPMAERLIIVPDENGPVPYQGGRYRLWYPDYDGLYWSDGRTLDVEGGDYQVIEYVRIADKIARRVRLLAIARIADRTLNSTPGSIAAAQQSFAKPLREMSQSVQINGNGDTMQDHEKTLMQLLLLLGGIIALGKVLASNEKITPRLIVGRVILGSAISVAAGAALVQFPDMSPLAVNGVGAGLGILGYQFCEMWLRRRLGGDDKEK